MNVICIVVMTIGQTAQGIVTGSELPTLDEIVSAHNDRVGAYLSVQMDWIVERTRLDYHRLENTPDNALTAVEVFRYRSEGESFRLEEEAERWRAYEWRMASSVSNLVAFHKGIGKSISRQNNKGYVFEFDPGVLSYRDDMAFLEHLVRVNPLYLTASNMAVLRVDAGAKGERLVVVGTTDYLKPNYVGSTRKEFYLDPDRGYILTGFRTMAADGTVRAEGSLEYGADPEWGPVPTSASVNYMGTRDGQPIMEVRIDITVTYAEFGEPLSPDTFELEFPIGLRVEDRISGNEYVVGDSAPIDPIAEWMSSLIAEADEPIAAALGADYETESDSRRTEVQSDRGSSSSLPVLPLLYLGASLAIVVAAWSVIRLRRRTGRGEAGD